VILALLANRSRGPLANLSLDLGELLALLANRSRGPLANLSLDLGAILALLANRSRGPQALLGNRTQGLLARMAIMACRAILALLASSPTFFHLREASGCIWGR